MFKFQINGIQTIFSKFNYNINNKWIFQYTTATKTPNYSDSMTKYLIKSLGFSKDEAFITCSKVTSFKSIENPNLVINFFKSNGLSDTQIKNLVFREPKILFCNVDKTLKPKFNAFNEIGFNGSDLAHLITVCPDICWRSFNNHIIPTLGILKSLFSINDDDDDNVMLINVVKKCSWLLGSTAKKNVPEVVALLKSYGLDDQQVKSFALRRARHISFGSKVLESILIRVEKLGIPRGTPMFYHGICALCSVSEATVECRMENYKRYGFSDEDVLTLARKNPYALLIPEHRLSKCLEFFLNDVGYKPVEIASLPYMLTFSLEKRVIPRYMVWKGLKEKGLLKGTKKRLKETDVSLITWLTHRESYFFEKYVKPFKDQCPDLYNEYIKVARPVVKAAKKNTN